MCVDLSLDAVGLKARECSYGVSALGAEQESKFQLTLDEDKKAHWQIYEIYIKENI